MSKKLSTKGIDVTWKFDLKEQIRNNFSNADWAHETQKVIDNTILKYLNSGISPVHGFKNFEKYKDPKKYPGDIKPSNKPNLKLSGAMHYAYRSKSGIDPMTIVLGIHKSESKSLVTIADANNQGTETILSKVARRKLKELKSFDRYEGIDTGDKKQRRKRNKEYKSIKNNLESNIKGIPARRFVPLKGESYKNSIVLEIRKLFAMMLDKAINKKGK